MIQGANDEVWTYDIPDQKFNRLTFEGRNASPVWTPDGKRITFRSDRGGTGTLNLFWMPADGSGEAERLTKSEYNQTASSWSSDGRYLIFNQVHPTSNADLWILPRESRQKPYPLLNTRFVEMGATFSPDDRWIAYVTNESGHSEVYIRPFSGSGGVHQVSSDGGGLPNWARSGELFYLNSDGMMAVDIKTAPTLKIGTPKMLFKAGLSSLAGFDVTPDGQRFLMIKSEETEQAAVKVQVILNWFEEIKKSVRTQ
jgi:Tol biopolymer transport system component